MLVLNPSKNWNSSIRAFCIWWNIPLKDFNVERCTLIKMKTFINRWIIRSHRYIIFRVRKCDSIRTPLRHDRHWWRKLPQVNRRHNFCRLSQTHDQLNKFEGELSRFIIWLSELELLKCGNSGRPERFWTRKRTVSWKELDFAITLIHLRFYE